jgi:aconitate hydratase
MSSNSYNAKQTLDVQGKEYDYFSIPEAEKQLGDLSKLPFSLKVLVENLLRFEDGDTVTPEHLQAFSAWLKDKKSNVEIAYRPARVLMQDFTGVPAVVDLAAMRDAMKAAGGNPERINPLNPVDLVIDHSIQVDEFGTQAALKNNTKIEMRRNQERYEFLRWGQDALNNFGVVPPGTGICHQVNLEYLSKAIWSSEIDGRMVAYPDTQVGTDSHTTMINGLGVLAWGVGGIEAEAAMLGQPVSMLIPEVVGFKLTGVLPEGTTATDLVLRVVQMLRAHGVVGKFVEFFGPGLQNLPLPDRATIANMAPEYGATCGIFPLDKIAVDYLHLSGRSQETIDLVEAYAKAQGMWHDANTPEAVFSSTLSLDMGTIEPSLAGPKRPQDRVALSDMSAAFRVAAEEFINMDDYDQAYPTGEGYDMYHGNVVIAAITSCTNTSNPSVMLAAGLVAKKAAEKGMTVKPWVKTSLAPGSKVVTEYLEKTGLLSYLNDLGFNIVGYGCTTCIGNSGPLPEAVSKVVSDNDLAVCSVLSGNRNFEGRVNPLVKANWLASPPLVVAYALSGSVKTDMVSSPLGQDQDGAPVYLKDIWPSNAEIAAEVAKISSEMFTSQYDNVFTGNSDWNSIDVAKGETYAWNPDSTYVRLPPFFEGLTKEVPDAKPISGARMLALLGDNVTTDHISPAGAIKADSPAGKYLQEHDVAQKDFNSYGSRRGNHEVMMRGTFGNIRIRNEMVPGTEGGLTKHYSNDAIKPIYDVAMQYQAEGTPLVVVGGKEYGMGSSRDWAAKGTMLLGVQAVIVESFERIHRSNLIGMGVIPLEFKDGMTRNSLNLTGAETFDVLGIDNNLKPRCDIQAVVHYPNGDSKEITLLCRIDTGNEMEYYLNQGILQYVLRKML